MTPLGFKEQYQFKSDLGYGGNYTEQFLYETGANDICGKCQVTPDFLQISFPCVNRPFTNPVQRVQLNAEMPIFSPEQNQKDNWSGSGSVTVNGRTCTEYTYSGPNTGQYQPLKVSYVTVGANNVPCHIEYVGGRILTFSEFASVETIDFTIPDDCRCHKRLDLLLCTFSLLPMPLSYRSISS